MADLDDDFDEEVLALPGAAQAATSLPGVGRAVELTVQAKTAGQRLDQYLAAQFPDFSRSLIQKAIEAKSVQTDAKRRRSSEVP